MSCLSEAELESVADDHPHFVNCTACAARFAAVRENLNLAGELQAMFGDFAVEPPSTERYAVRELLGKGGMGAIFAAEDRHLRRAVALKVSLNGDAHGRFHREACVTGQLEHPNIVPVHDLGTDSDGRPFYSMKQVRGVSLRDVLDGKAKALSLPRLLNCFLRVCDGMAFAHSQGIIHRDLKPDNVMLGKFGEVLILDWGLAKVLGEREEKVGKLPTGITAECTLHGEVLGTPAYMSPEQARGDELDVRADVYALGAILYHILTGRPPVDGPSAAAVLLKVNQGCIAPPEDAPDALAAIAMKALAAHPDQRYASAADLRDDVQLFLEDRAISAMEDSLMSMLMRVVRRHRAVVIVAAAALVVIAGLVAIGYQLNLKERQRAEAALANAEIARQEAEAASARAEEARAELAATTARTAQELAEQAIRASAQGRLAEADARADAAMRLGKDLPWGHYAFAVISDTRGERFEAERLLRNALFADPEHQPSKLRLAKLKGDDEAIADARAFVAYVGPEVGWRELAEAGELLLKGREFIDAMKAFTLAHERAQQTKGLQRDIIAQLDEQRMDARAWHLADGFYERVRTMRTDEQEDELKKLMREIHEKYIETRMTWQDGELTSVRFSVDTKFIQPLAGMPLRELDLSHLRGLRNLEPLRGMPLQKLNVYNSAVRDLEPLRGMPLEKLTIGETLVSDLTPIAGMPLTHLNLHNLTIKDLSPLRGMQLTQLHIQARVPSAELEVIRDMPLEYLGMPPQAKSLAIVQGMPLKSLSIHGISERNLDLLKGMTIEDLRVPWNIADISAVADLPKLKKLRGLRFGAY
jgi:hypothetical protein